MSLLQVTSCGRRIDLAIAQDLSLSLVDVGPAASGVLELADEGMGSSFTMPVCDGSLTVRAADFSPLELFQFGEQGVWYDPSDFSTMFQDNAGTTPVTAVGQAVGRILDKSGRGNHASQATPTSRPILRQDGTGRYYLEFDGVDDFLITGSINPGSVDKVQSFVGLRKNSDTLAGLVFETGTNVNANNGSCALTAPNGAGAATYAFISRGTTTRAPQLTSFAAPVTTVISGTSDILAPLISTRANGGASSTSSALSQGTGNYLTYPMYIGRRGGATLPFNGRLYGLVVRFSSANLATASLENGERWMNGKTGAY